MGPSLGLGRESSTGAWRAARWACPGPLTSSPGEVVIITSTDTRGHASSLLSSGVAGRAVLGGLDADSFARCRAACLDARGRLALRPAVPRARIVCQRVRQDMFPKDPGMVPRLEDTMVSNHTIRGYIARAAGKKLPLLARGNPAARKVEASRPRGRGVSGTLWDRCYYEVPRTECASPAARATEEILRIRPH